MLRMGCTRKTVVGFKTNNFGLVQRNFEFQRWKLTYFDRRHPKRSVTVNAEVWQVRGRRRSREVAVTCVYVRGEHDRDQLELAALGEQMYHHELFAWRPATQYQ